MNFSFSEALTALGPNAGFRLINGARPPADYYLETLLPEQNKSSYYVESAHMTIRATMAGLVGMSSPYPPGGKMDASSFLEKTAKLALKVTMEEEQIRQIQELLRQLGGNATGDKQRLMTEVTNFYEKVVIQGLLDRAEWLRAQCLFFGEIDWTFNNKNLLVDYGVPASHFLTPRTGNDAYNAEHADNKFWVDHYEAQRLLRYNLRVIVANTKTIDAIINTDQLNVDVSKDGNRFTFTRYRSRDGNNERRATDARDSISIVAYDGEGEVLDPADLSATQILQFVPDGKILYVGNNRRSGYRVGEGSTPDPVRDLALGYTHIAPTVEGDGRPGRWGRIYIPEDAQWSVRAEGVQNLLPVREDVTETEAKTVVLTTTIS